MSPGDSKVEWALEPIKNTKYEFSDYLGLRLENNLHHWILTAPYSNPAMIEMLRDRDKKPPRELNPWDGEYPGKYLISAVLCWRISPNPELRHVIQYVVDQLIEVQDGDGYLGPFSRDQRFDGYLYSKSLALHQEKNGIPSPHKALRIWDLWGHYHCLLGLLLWYQESGYEPAFNAVIKTADLICDKYLYGAEKMVNTGAEEMNLAIIHLFCLLYKETGSDKYFNMAREIVDEFQSPQAGDYIHKAMDGVEFYSMPKTRWESLHCLQGIGEMYSLTGDAKYRQAFEHIWWSIVKYDRHNNGGFSTNEKAIGNPFLPGVIETCCTTAWLAYSIDMLKMTGFSGVADEIELSTFNAALGAQHPSGRWWTYNTPMEGYRRAFYEDHNWQAHPGSPELNCCINGPRTLGMISEWAIMKSPEGIALNYYGPSRITLNDFQGKEIIFQQETLYPRDHRVRLSLFPKEPIPFSLNLRIPSWSNTTRVLVNDDQVSPIKPVSFSKAIPIENRWPQPWVLVTIPTETGTNIVLCDFATAGATGSPYWSWLPVKNMESIPFSKKNPLRTQRVKNVLVE
ncbi:MAG: glycoside hydrolase family 127 protein [Candidatus Atribacteria bacterium]|nr:glycoside hydrolase family 127 protein [Candidatus Atribacteria bacterium]